MFLMAEFWDFVRLRYLRSNKCERDSSLFSVKEKHNWIIKICHAAKPDVAFGGDSIHFAKVGVKDSMRHPAGFGAVPKGCEGEDAKASAEQESVSNSTIRLSWYRPMWQ